jgi:hypothetical protein
MSATNRKRSEATEQVRVVNWSKAYSIKYPELKLLFHVPNGGSRNRIEAQNLKAQGVKAGVPDLCLPVPHGSYHGLYIELKYSKNKTTELQEWWLAQLAAQDYKTAVCYGADEAMDTIAHYLEIEEETGRRKGDKA